MFVVRWVYYLLFLGISFILLSSSGSALMRFIGLEGGSDLFNAFVDLILVASFVLTMYLAPYSWKKYIYRKSTNESADAVQSRT